MAKAKNNGKGKPIQAPPTTSTDLTLTQSGDTLTTTISPNAQWAGIQKFVDQNSNDGAISVGNWNFNAPPGVGTTKSVQTQGTGYYRGWSSDFYSYNVHLSNWIFVP
jgi:hypothetical protein